MNEIPFVKHEVRVVSHTGGEKGSKLARYDLIPADVEEALAEHFGKGASKYEDRNWERGYNWSLSYASLRRHLAAFWRGEDYDEIGSLHIVAALWHAVALAHFQLNEKYHEFDNRVKVSEQLQLQFEGLDEIVHEEQGHNIEPLPPMDLASIVDRSRKLAEEVNGVNEVSKGQPVEEVIRSASRRFDQYIVREDEWQGKGATKRYKGSASPIDHEGNPVYRPADEVVTPVYRSAPIETQPPSVIQQGFDSEVLKAQKQLLADLNREVWGSSDGSVPPQGQMPYSRPNYLKDEGETNYRYSAERAAHAGKRARNVVDL